MRISHKKTLQQAPLLQRLLINMPGRISHSDWVCYVAESLSKLLNARQGAACSCKDYGLPDFNELTHMPAQLIKMLERSMLQTINTYEPRLSQVRVMGRLDEEFPDRIRFSIYGVLTLGEEKHHVSYQSVMTPGGRMIVKM
jgi:type VI secretion system protein